MKIFRPLQCTLLLVSILTGCSGPRSTPPEARSRVIELGPLAAPPGGGTTRFARAPLDTTELEWVTGFEAAAPAPGDSGAPWHVDLRLANGTRLLVAGPGLPPISFPPGFGLPLGQILRDTPGGWRKAELVASAPTDAPMRVTLAAAPARPGDKDEPPALKRLYVLSLPLLDDGAPETEAPPGADGNLLTDPRAFWPVPAGGEQARRGKFSYLVPTDVTVHYAAAWFQGPARSVRLTDLGDGKVLWQAEAQAGTIPSYTSANGFPLYREHEYEVEVAFDHAGPEPVPGAAALFLYYRPPGDEAFSYPFPPAGDGAGQ